MAATMGAIFKVSRTWGLLLSSSSCKNPNLSSSFSLYPKSSSQYRAVWGSSSVGVDSLYNQHKPARVFCSDSRNLTLIVKDEEVAAEGDGGEMVVSLRELCGDKVPQYLLQRCYSESAICYLEICFFEIFDLVYERHGKSKISNGTLLW